MVRVYAGYWRLVFLMVLIVFSVFSTGIVLSLGEGEVLLSKMHLTVGENPGVDISSELLEFGRLSVLGTSKKFVTLENEGGAKTVYITAFGELKNWVKVSDNDFIMYGGESKRISIMVAVPENARMGDYDGFLKIRFVEKR